MANTKLRDLINEAQEELNVASMIDYDYWKVDKQAPKLIKDLEKFIKDSTGMACKIELSKYLENIMLVGIDLIGQTGSFGKNYVHTMKFYFSHPTERKGRLVFEDCKLLIELRNKNGLVTQEIEAFQGKFLCYSTSGWSLI